MKAPVMTGICRTGKDRGWEGEGEKEREKRLDKI
jgi:hypothetical protein